LATNPRYRYSIMEALADEDFRPKRYNEVWSKVEDEIGSERTLSLYLKEMEREGLIARRQISHKKVMYEIIPAYREQWAFVAERDPFRKLPTGVHMRRIMSYLLEQLGDKKQALDLALKYAFASFFRMRSYFASQKLVLADRKKRSLVIERELRYYQLFLKFIESFLQDNHEASSRWIEAARSDAITPLAKPKKIRVVTGYPLQDSLNYELELLAGVVKETDPDLAKGLHIPDAARRIGSRLYREIDRVMRLVGPTEDAYGIIGLRDEIELEVLPLIYEKMPKNRKISLKELRKLYNETTGKILTSAALAQAIEAAPRGSPLWVAIKGEPMIRVGRVRRPDANGRRDSPGPSRRDYDSP